MEIYIVSIGIYTALMGVYSALVGVYTALIGVHTALLGLYTTLIGVYTALEGVCTALIRIYICVCVCTLLKFESKPTLLSFSDRQAFVRVSYHNNTKVNKDREVLHRENEDLG